MTREEFIREVNDWQSLRFFCAHELIDTCECVYSCEDIEDEIDDEIIEFLEYGTWRNLRDILSDLCLVQDTYYLRHGILEYEPLDGIDFARYKEIAMAEMDGQWDGEERDINERRFLYNWSNESTSPTAEDDEFEIAENDELLEIFAA